MIPAMIFPGMDPYLEHPQLWTGVHARMITYLCDLLQPQITPRYVAAIEERVYLEESHRIPDVIVRRLSRPRKNGRAAAALLEADEPIVVEAAVEEIHERFLTIIDPKATEKVITVIELVSPTNKRAGPGRESYLAKQREVIHGEANLVEIDLLRNGAHVLAVPEKVAKEHAEEYHYLTCVNRAAKVRDKYDLYPRTLQERLPRIRIPLVGRDSDVVLDIQAALAQTYEAARYDLRIRYDRPCVPPLSRIEQTWANQLIRPSKKSNGRKN